MSRRRLSAATAVAAFAGAAVVPLLNADSVFVAQLAEICLFVLAVVGLNIALGHCGLMSLCTGALMGLGAFASASVNIVPYLPTRWAFVGVLLSIVIGSVIGAAAGLILMLPSLRLGRMAYAMVSLFIAAEFVDASRLRGVSSLTGGTHSLNNVPALIPLSSVGSNDVLQAQMGYWIVLGVTALGFFICRRLVSSHWGRAFHIVRDDEVAASALGISPNHVRVVALMVASMAAAVAGALSVHTSFGCVETCTVGARDFDLQLSIILFSALIVGGPGRLLGPVVGALTIGFFYVFLVGNISDSNSWVTHLLHSDLPYGLLLLLVSVLLPSGLVGGVVTVWTWLIARSDPGDQLEISPPQLLTLPAMEGADILLENVRVAFGGNVALDELSLQAKSGVVHALVGPNGSGKTTLLNVISGFVEAPGAAVRLGDVLLSGNPAKRARTGIGRTFQTPRLEANATAETAVMTGSFARHVTTLSSLYLRPFRYRRESSKLHTEARAMLAGLGLSHRIETKAGALPHGERRLVEVARALISRPRLLLLDEPAAGLSPAEMAHLASVIDAAARSGCTVILVEHNLAFVRRVATTVTALDRGHILATGDTATVLSRQDVLTCFVGDSAA